MHIANEEFHPDLQSQVPRLRRMVRLMKVPGFISLVAWVRRRATRKNIDELSCESVTITSSLDGYSIRTRIYRPRNSKESLPCLVYFHGGYIIERPGGLS